MRKELQNVITADLQRYYDSDSIPFFKPIQVRYIIAYRKASFHSKKTLKGVYYRARLKSLSERTGIQIPTKAKIGAGFYIGHFGTIIINPDVKIGENVNIASGVTIGKTNRGEKKGVPTIGNQVWIGTNAVVVGNIMIGDDVLIAPNSYVNIDIPSHSVVIGNPAVIYKREDATEGYINRTI